jgi:hypothetical protein
MLFPLEIVDALLAQGVTTFKVQREFSFIIEKPATEGTLQYIQQSVALELFVV